MLILGNTIFQSNKTEMKITLNYLKILANPCYGIGLSSCDSLQAIET